MWHMAMDLMFNVTYWPYIQSSTVYNCVYVFFGDSWYNLSPNYATYYDKMKWGLVLAVLAL